MIHNMSCCFICSWGRRTQFIILVSFAEFLNRCFIVFELSYDFKIFHNVFIYFKLFHDYPEGKLRELIFGMVEQITIVIEITIRASRADPPNHPTTHPTHTSLFSTRFLNRWHTSLPFLYTKYFIFDQIRFLNRWHTHTHTHTHLESTLRKHPRKHTGL